MNQRWTWGAGVVVGAVAAAWLAMSSVDTGEDPSPPPVRALERAAPVAAVRAPGPAVGTVPAPRPPVAPVGDVGAADDEDEEAASDAHADRLRAAASRAVRGKVAKVHEQLDAALATVRDDGLRDEVRAAVDRAVARMRGIEHEVDGGVDPVEAYTRVHEVKQDVVLELRQLLGDDAGPALEAMGVAPDGTDPDLGWGIPLEELGWDVVFSEE